MGHNAIVFSQTKTFDYLNASLSTTACNVFNPTVTIDGSSHNSWAGGVSLNSTLGLVLATQQKISPPQSTAFKIDYSFATGMSYEIKITAYGNTDVLLQACVVPDITNFPTSSQTSCTLDAFAFSYNLNSATGYGKFSTATSTTSTIYTIPKFDIPIGGTPCLYLFIWSSGGKPALNLDALYISKITITATPITTPVSFTIPTTTTISCGSTTAQTFTVTNVNGTGGVTNYTWNLGTTPNNWLYNNAAAPATVTTGITNTITLTPVCGSTPKNISATVTANLTAYNTNTSTVSISQPVMSISGNSPICTSQNYLITGLPSCNTTVLWSVSPTGIVTPNTSTSATPTFTKAANGNITLSATVTSCGVVQPAITKIIRVGGYTSSDYPITGPSSTTCGTLVTYSVPQLSSSSTYTWMYQGSPWQYQGGQGTRLLQMRAPTSTSGGVFSVHVDNACGIGPFTSKTTSVSCSFALIDLFQVLPNPATNEVTVMANSISTTSFTELNIYNQHGVLKKTQKFAKVKKGTINVSSLSTGIYFIEIVNGTNRVRQQLSILK
jgi:hypothetical protein